MMLLHLVVIFFLNIKFQSILDYLISFTILFFSKFQNIIFFLLNPLFYKVQTHDLHVINFEIRWFFEEWTLWNQIAESFLIFFFCLATMLLIFTGRRQDYEKKKLRYKYERWMWEKLHISQIHIPYNTHGITLPISIRTTMASPGDSFSRVGSGTGCRLITCFQATFQTDCVLLRMVHLKLLLLPSIGQWWPSLTPSSMSLHTNHSCSEAH